MRLGLGLHVGRGRAGAAAGGGGGSSEPVAFVDLFTGANGTALTSHTPDTDVEAGGWPAHFNHVGTSPAPEIQSNRATVTNAGSTAVAGIVADMGAADVVLAATITTRNTNGSGNNGLVLRYVDEDNYLIADLVGGFGNAVRILKIEGGVETILASTTVTIAINTAYGMTVSLNGDTITVNACGVTVQTTTTFNQAATQHGLLIVSGSSTATKIDNFGVLVPANVTTLVSDTFTDSDDTLLPDHAPDTDTVGGGWLADVSYVGTSPGNRVTSNQATVPTGGSTAVTASLIETGKANGVLSADVTTAGVFLGANGVTFRATDADDHWQFDMVPSGSPDLRLLKTEGGSETTVLSANPTVAATTQYPLTVYLIGPIIAAVGRGWSLVTVSAFLQSVTTHGLVTVKSGSSGASRIDNFVFEG